MLREEIGLSKIGIVTGPEADAEAVILEQCVFDRCHKGIQKKSQLSTIKPAESRLS